MPERIDLPNGGVFFADTPSEKAEKEKKNVAKEKLGKINKKSSKTADLLARIEILEDLLGIK